MQKYGLRPLPDDFEPTREEQILLDMYETVRNYERQAGRLREEAARNKLAAKDAEFQQKKAPKKNKRKRKNKVETTGVSDQEEEDEEDAEVDETMEEEETDDPEKLHQRREAKLAALREEVEEAKQAQESNEDVLRTQHLTTTEIELDAGPLKKKPKTEEPSSLIANITAAVTPPHDFSEKLGLTRGKVLFPKSTDEAKWSPPEGAAHPNEGAFAVELEDFNVIEATNGSGNNTLAIKLMAPSDSKRFSLNIAAPDHDDFQSVLFHFNPRHHERGGQLVINNKQEGIWGQSINIPLSQIPLIFGQTAVTLMIQINGEGFDVFLENEHCARLEHRKELPTGNTNLALQFPSTDDYGSPENWVVYRVWWGNKPILAKGDLSGVAGVNIYSSLHPRKVFVSGLTKIFTEPEVDLRRAELERAFRKYGGDRGVSVIVPTNTTYAFVEMESERQTDLALREMATQYRLNRARRSRHEALQEQRQAAEAGAGTEQETATGWD